MLGVTGHGPPKKKLLDILPGLRHKGKGKEKERETVEPRAAFVVSQPGSFYSSGEPVLTRSHGESPQQSTPGDSVPGPSFPPPPSEERLGLFEFPAAGPGPSISPSTRHVE